MPRHLKLLLTAALTCALSAFLFAEPSRAANRFWVPINVTGAADNGSGLCRLTVGANLATGKVTGETVTVASISGATECNGTFVATAIDSTHIDLQGTTFNLVYVSGGTISGGTWNATNIGNWGTSTGGAGGSAVPTASDAVTIDGSSGGATVTPGAAYTPLMQSLTIGAYTGTLDFSANNPSISANFVSLTGAATKTLNMGSGTWTLTGGSTATVWDCTTCTNLTLNANTSTLVFSTTGANQSRNWLPGAKTYSTVTIAESVAGRIFTINGSVTIASLTITAPLNIVTTGTSTTTVTTSFIQASASSTVLSSIEAGGVWTISDTIGSGTFALTWTAVRGITCSGAGVTFSFTNSFNLGGITSCTVTAPSGGLPAVGGGIIGGGL